MKVAILFFGRIYCHEIFFKNLTTVFGNHDYDFFLSTDPSLKEDVDSFINLYHPKKVTQDPLQLTNIYDDFPRQFCVNVHNLKCQYMNKLRVQALLDSYIQETSTQYDVIICSRLDLVFDQSIDLTSLNKQNTIYIPKGMDCMSIGLNEMIAIGNYEVIKKYTNIYNNVMILLLHGCPLQTESLTRANVNYYGLILERIDVTMYFIHPEGDKRRFA